MPYFVTVCSVLVAAALGLASCANPWRNIPADDPATSKIRAVLLKPGRMIHGNYCGRKSVDGTLRHLPVDALDVACQAHDICYIEGRHHCECDAQFRYAVDAFIANPDTSDNLRRKARLVRSTFALPVCKAFPDGVMPPRDPKLLDEINVIPE